MAPIAPIPRHHLRGRLEDVAEAEVELGVLHIAPLPKRSGPNNWTTPPHAHPDHTQLLYVREGGGVIEIEGSVLPVPVPALLVVPPTAVHQLRFRPRTDGWVVTVADSYVSRAAGGDQRMTETARRAGVLPLAGTGLDPARVDATFRNLMREFVGSAPGHRAAVRAHFVVVLVMTMRARLLEFGPEVVPDDRAHALVLHYRDLIEAHFREERRIAYYADLLAVTPARLNTACQSRLGTTASGLLHNRIVTEAKRCLICTSMSVAEIGYALGFEDPAYFSRFFSKRVGVAPGRLREVLGAEPAGTS
jgi:AraC family transcriptional activator of pobA